jgi:hypothetical protein
MAKMQTRTRRVPLDFLGDGWESAYIDFRRGHWRDTEVIEAIQQEKKGTDGLIAILQHMFAGGQMVDETGQLVEMVAENIAEFDNEALIELSEKMQGNVDPKASGSSTTTSPAADENLSSSPDSSIANDSDSATPSS